MNLSLKRDIFQNNQCFIIAEVAQAHDGSLGMAHAFIDAAAKTGVDAIKFQTHIAEAESTPVEPWRVKFSYQDNLRYDYWKRMEFTPDQWAGLKKHAEEKDMVFLSSPFSIEAVDLLEKLGMVAWKIASGEITNYPMLERIFDTGKPILVSSGMSDLPELDKLIETINNKNIDFAVMQCTSSYPTPPEKVGLNVMSEFRNRYNCKVGLSDHSGTIYPALAAATLGMDVLEIHLTLSRDMFGPDVVASVTVEEMKQMVEGIRFIEKMKANPVVKNKAAEDMNPMRRLFTKSIVAKKDLEKGSVLSLDDVAFKKPGTGIPAANYLNVIGKKLNKSVSYNYIFKEEDFI